MTPYGDEEYGMPVELNANGIKKIIEFLCAQGPDEAGIDNLQALLEPVMIIFLAVVVGGIVLAVILPMFGLYEQIN